MVSFLSREKSLRQAPDIAGRADLFDINADFAAPNKRQHSHPITMRNVEAQIPPFLQKRLAVLAVTKLQRSRIFFQIASQQKTESAARENELATRTLHPILRRFLALFGRK